MVGISSTYSVDISASASENLKTEYKAVACRVGKLGSMDVELKVWCSAARSSLDFGHASHKPVRMRTDRST